MLCTEARGQLGVGKSLEPRELSFATLSRSLGGQTKSVWISWENVKTKIGNTFVP